MSLGEYGKPKELTIPVPYGHLAAKEWGPPNGQKLLGLHGWLHNASAFDDLVLYLPPVFHFVVLDFPGHGKSSHLPIGAKYSRLQMIIDTRRVINFLGWKRFSIVGHSLGGHTALFYAGAYPQEVQNVISLDVFYPSRTIMTIPFQKGIEKFLGDEEKETGPQSSINEKETFDTLARQLEGASHKVIQALFDRSTCRLPDNSLVLTRDYRLKSMLDLPMELSGSEAIYETMGKIKARVLIIFGSDSFYAYTEPKHQQKLGKLLEKNCRSFRKVFVQSNHSPHMENPQAVANHMIKLLIGKSTL